MFLSQIILLLAVGLFWWRLTHRRLNALRHRLAWRVVLAFWALGMIFFPIAGNIFGHLFYPIFPAAGWIWHVFAAPMGILILIAFDLYSKIARRVRQSMDKPTDLSRRRTMISVAAAMPPLITGGL